MTDTNNTAASVRLTVTLTRDGNDVFTEVAAEPTQSDEGLASALALALVAVLSTADHRAHMAALEILRAGLVTEEGNND